MCRLQDRISELLASGNSFDSVIKKLVDESLAEVEQGALPLVETMKSVGSIPNLHLVDRPDHLGDKLPSAAKRASVERGYKLIRAQFKTEIHGHVIDYLYKKSEYKQAINRFRESCQKFYHKAFVYGMRWSAGTADTPRLFQLSQENLQFVAKAAKEEAGYFEGFMKDLRFKRTGKNGKMQWWDRLDLYLGTMDSMFEAGKVAGAPDLYVFDWVVDRQAEHCEGCVYIESNSPYTKETIPCQPRDGSTECLTHCKCTLKMRKVSESEYAAVSSRGLTKDALRLHLRLLKERKVGTKRLRKR